MFIETEADIFFAHLESPIGILTVLARNEGLSEIRFPNHKAKALANEALMNEALADKALPRQRGQLSERLNTHVEAALAQLSAYFSGELRHFDLQLCAQGTDFQQQVWSQLQTASYGVTMSYGEIATALGKPTAARAVGMANSKNPIPIVVPCHRIIGSNGALTGFAGGLDTKRWLLAHEQG